MRKDPYWMTVVEACEKFKVSDTIIYRWIKQDRIPNAVRHGRRVVKRDAERPEPLQRGQGAWIHARRKRRVKSREALKISQESAQKESGGIAGALRRGK